MAIETVEILFLEDNRNDTELVICTLRKGHNSRMGLNPSSRFSPQVKSEDKDIGNEPKVVFLDLKVLDVVGSEILIQKANQGVKTNFKIVPTSANQRIEFERANFPDTNRCAVKTAEFSEFIKIAAAIDFCWLLENQAPI